jgi:hypothetical protein
LQKGDSCLVAEQLGVSINTVLAKRLSIMKNSVRVPKVELVLEAIKRDQVYIDGEGKW